MVTGTRACACACARARPFPICYNYELKGLRINKDYSEIWSAATCRGFV